MSPAYRSGRKGFFEALNGKFRDAIVLIFDESGSIFVRAKDWTQHHPLETLWLVGTRAVFLVELPELGVVAVMSWGIYKMIARWLDKDLRRQLEVALADNDALAQDNVLLREEVRAAQEENTHLNEENVALVRDNDELREELANSRKTSEDLREELAAAQERIADLETTVRNMQ